MAIKDLFDQIGKRASNARDVTVKISYLEIYNEHIRDLLSNEENPIDIREDPTKGTFIAGMTECIVQNEQ